MMAIWFWNPFSLEFFYCLWKCYFLFFSFYYSNILWNLISMLCSFSRGFLKESWFRELFLTSQSSLLFMQCCWKLAVWNFLAFFSFSTIIWIFCFFSSSLFVFCSISIFLLVVSVQCEALSWEQELASCEAVGGLFLPACILVFVGVSYHLVLFKTSMNYYFSV